MNFITRTAAIMLSAACALGAMATAPDDEQHEALAKDHKLIFFGEGETPQSDSIRNLVENFYYDQFRSFQDPQAPYFLFMSRDSQLAMGIGGMVRMRGYFDWGGTTGTPGFSPYFIPTQRDELNRQRIGSSPAGTALFFRVIGRNKRLGDYQLYIEANFNGYRTRDFHLKKAYATINDWTIGYASSTFGDGAAVPPTIDASGPTMKMDGTNVLVRYMHHFRKSGIYVAASVETPDMTVQEDGTSTAARSQFMPNIAAMVQYEWLTGQHIRLSAITRFLPYRDMINSRNHRKWAGACSSAPCSARWIPSRSMPQSTAAAHIQTSAATFSLANMTLWPTPKNPDSSTPCGMGLLRRPAIQFHSSGLHVGHLRSGPLPAPSRNCRRQRLQIWTLRSRQSVRYLTPRISFGPKPTSGSA